MKWTEQEVILSVSEDAWLAWSQTEEGGFEEYFNSRRTWLYPVDNSHMTTRDLAILGWNHAQWFQKATEWYFQQDEERRKRNEW